MKRSFFFEILGYLIALIIYSVFFEVFVMVATIFDMLIHSKSFVSFFIELVHNSDIIWGWIVFLALSYIIVDNLEKLINATVIIFRKTVSYSVKVRLIVGITLLLLGLYITNNVVFPILTGRAFLILSDFGNKKCGGYPDCTFPFSQILSLIGTRMLEGFSQLFPEISRKPLSFVVTVILIVLLILDVFSRISGTIDLYEKLFRRKKG